MGEDQHRDTTLKTLEVPDSPDLEPEAAPAALPDLTLPPGWRKSTKVDPDDGERKPWYVCENDLTQSDWDKPMITVGTMNYPPRNLHSTTFLKRPRSPGSVWQPWKQSPRQRSSPSWHPSCSCSWCLFTSSLAVLRPQGNPNPT